MAQALRPLCHWDGKGCMYLRVPASGGGGGVWICLWHMVSFTPQGVHDVRLAYIQFALSFLIAGDDSTIVQVLELKGRFPPFVS